MLANLRGPRKNVISGSHTSHALACGAWSAARVSRRSKPLPPEHTCRTCPECMYERPPPFVLTGNLQPGAVLRCQMKRPGGHAESRLPHASYLGLRSDKPARDVTREV